MIVRNGEDAHIIGRDEHYRPVTRNYAYSVYLEMGMQVCRDYSSLPPVRDMTLNEVRTFYDFLRPELKKATEPKKHGK